MSQPADLRAYFARASQPPATTARSFSALAEPVLEGPTVDVSSPPSSLKRARSETDQLGSATDAPPRARNPFRVVGRSCPSEPLRENVKDAATTEGTSPAKRQRSPAPSAADLLEGLTDADFAFSQPVPLAAAPPAQPVPQLVPQPHAVAEDLLVRGLVFRPGVSNDLAGAGR